VLSILRRLDLFYISLPICAAVAVLGLVSPAALEFWARGLVSTVFRGLDWFFLASMSGFVLLCLWLGFGPFGRIKLGRPDDQPDFSTASWLAMLFAAGMGVGLLFWGVAEPVNHFASPPLAEGGTGEAARSALTLTIFHWGLHAWGVYCLSGMVLAYFGFRYGAPHLAGSPIRASFRGPWVKPVAWAADLVAVLAVAFGVAGSTGTGVMQLQAGLHSLAGVPLDSSVWAFAILAVLVVTYISSAITGLDKGIKWLSNLNMALALLLVAYLLVAGPTAFLVRGFFTALGDYLSGIIGLSLQSFPYEKPGSWPETWLETWTLTNFVWWVAWAPFVGVFIARVSRGRTIREFVLGVLFVPSVFSLLWFVTFGGTAIYEELFGAGGMERLVREDVTAALFALFDRLPGSVLLGVLAVFLAFIFLVTSLNSATFVLGMLTSNGRANPPISRQLAWGFGLGAFSGALLLSGNVHALRAVTISGAIPFILILLLQMVALLRGLRVERANLRAPAAGPAYAGEGG
jgi:glycine betaine transporter